MSQQQPEDPRSTFAILASLPQQVIALVKAELQNIKLELIAKGKHIGIGVGLFVVAAAILFFMLGVLVAAAVLGIAVALPAWLSALIVAAGLLVLAGLCGLIGIMQIKKATPPLDESIESINDDIQAVRGGDDGY